MKTLIFSMTSILASMVWAQPLTPSTPVTAKPVSVSYKNLIDCFPELTDESLSFKVDLSQLKELTDEKFVTSRSQLVQRQIFYQTAEGEKRRMTLRAKNPDALKVTFELKLDMVDDKEVYTEAALTEAQRINPKQEMLNHLLLNTTTQRDVYSYHDTKLNGVVLKFRREHKVVEELELIDKPRKRSVSCEAQKEGSVICTCSKK